MNNENSISDWFLNISPAWSYRGLSFRTRCCGRVVCGVKFGNHRHWMIPLSRESCCAWDFIIFLEFWQEIASSVRSYWATLKCVTQCCFTRASCLAWRLSLKFYTLMKASGCREHAWTPQYIKFSSKSLNMLQWHVISKDTQPWACQPHLSWKFANELDSLGNDLQPRQGQTNRQNLSTRRLP